MNNQTNPYSTPQQHGMAVTGERAAQVLKNTYMLLGLSLIMATGASWIAMTANVGIFSPLLTVGVAMAMIFAIQALRNSGFALLLVFALTSWLGFTTGPIINAFSQTAAGTQIVTTALGGTAGIFVAMSAISLVTRKDFSFLGNFLFAGLLVAFFAGIANFFFEIPALSLAVAAAFMLFSSLIIMWQTSAIIHGGETNYILATVTLFVSLYNIFMSLLSILSILGGDD